MEQYQQRGPRIFCRETCVAKVVFNDGQATLYIQQGMPKAETIEKIKTDAPVFFKEFGIRDDLVRECHPRLFLY